MLEVADLAKDRCSGSGRFAPTTVVLGSLFEQSDPGCVSCRAACLFPAGWWCRRALVGAFEFRGVEVRRVVDDLLLASSEVAELLVGEVVEASCCVTVDGLLGMFVGGLCLGTDVGRAGTNEELVGRDLVAFAVGGDCGRGGEPGALPGRVGGAGAEHPGPRGRRAGAEFGADLAPALSHQDGGLSGQLEARVLAGRERGVGADTPCGVGGGIGGGLETPVQDRDR